jgi:nucleoside-diphosphate-sugar epimerase
MTDPIVLVTGATGFIGGAVVARVLQDRFPGKLLLLARGATDADAAERVRRSVARFADLTELDFSRCEIHCADLTEPGTLADARLDAVTHVLHLASNTSFRSVRGVRRVNIFGTLALAHRLRRVPALQRFLHVSTAYLCGARATRVVHEDDFPRPDARHLVEYTASKAECEMLLEATAPELPLVVARPSVVVGHTALGVRPSASLWWFYRTSCLLRRTAVPLDLLEDVVPVDYVAGALLFLLFRPTLAHRRYHVSAGLCSAVSWRAIAAAFADAAGESPEEPWREVDFATVVAERGRLAGRLGAGDEGHLLEALELYFRFGSVGVEAFDNARLLAEGMDPPPPFTNCLPRCVATSAGRSVYEQMRDDE